MGIVYGLRLQAGEMYVLVYSFIYELVACAERGALCENRKPPIV